MVTSSTSTQLIFGTAPKNTSSPFAAAAAAFWLQQRNFPVSSSFVPSESSPVKINASSISGSTQVCRFLGRKYVDAGLYGSGMDPIIASDIDAWIDFATDHFATSDFKLTSAAVLDLNEHLKMRSFLVGYTPSLADVVVWGTLRGSPVWLKMIKSPKDCPVNVSRWYNHIGSLPWSVAAVEFLQKGASDVKESRGDQASYDIDLVGAEEGKVVTRFPPEPSGYLHIGHAKAALLNQYFAKAYKGKLIVRFDDTNPSKEKVEFEESILEDLELLEIKGDVVTWTSNYFQQLYDYAIKLIKSGKAYADNTPQEQMRKERMDGIASKNRDLSVDENLRLFEEMKNGTATGQTYCIRAKMSVDCKNKAMRDPVIYRCNLLPHNRTGTQWKMYPTYDFACPIVDSIEGVTHALRTNEYHDRNDQYYWFIDALDLRKPHIWDYSRMNFVYTLLSKRKLQWFVDNKLVAGWNDPRFPTVRGILRRGLTLEALKKYILMQGPSKNTILLEWDKIWTLNKQIIDPVAPRFVALLRENLTRLQLIDGPNEPFTKDMPKHKKNAEVGTKTTVFSKTILLDYADAATLENGEEITLMDWGNIIIQDVQKDAAGKVTGVNAKLHLEGDFKKTKKKFTWLADTDRVTPVELLDYDFLITKKKLEENDSFEDCLNAVTVYKDEAVGDLNINQLKKGDIIQLERRGYYIVDEPFATGLPAKLISIPDGKLSSIIPKAEAVKLAQAKSDPKGAKTKAEDSKKSNKKQKKGEASGKSAKGNDVPVDTVMYKMEQIYIDGEKIDTSKAKEVMYTVKSVY